MTREGFRHRSKWLVVAFLFAACGEQEGDPGAVPSTPAEATELARLPHVATRLQSGQTQSCLGSWNLTLVFDSMEQPRRVAAVYDQWEW